MSHSAQPASATGRFDADELITLAKTADALCAYLGKPVLAEIGLSDAGYEWVTFGVPMARAESDDPNEIRVQLGGPNSRLVGTRGGLLSADTEIYDCLYLWAVQITPEAHERFVKLDGEGEETAWSDSLVDVLPFALSDDDMADEDTDDDANEDEDEDEDEDHRDDDGADPRKGRTDRDAFEGIDYSRRH